MWMLLCGDLKDYLCVLFKQITYFIKKVLWLKLHIDDLFSCIVGCKMITLNQFGAKPFSCNIQIFSPIELLFVCFIIIIIIYIYIYIYKTETSETPTIFHVSTILKKTNKPTKKT